MKTYFLALFSIIVLGNFNTAFADMRCSVEAGNENNWVSVSSIYLQGEKATLNFEKTTPARLRFQPIVVSSDDKFADDSTDSYTGESTTRVFKSEVIEVSEEQYSFFYLFEQISTTRWKLSEYKNDKAQDAFGLSASVEMICK